MLVKSKFGVFIVNTRTSFLTSKTDGMYSPSVFYKIAENRQLGDKPTSKTAPNFKQKT